MALDLKDAVVAVTGAGSGIGRMVAMELARRGATVALSDIRPEAVRRTQELIDAEGAVALADTVDVADQAAVNSWARAVTNRLGHVDAVVSNAGVVLPTRTLDQTPVDQFRRLVDINLWGTVHTTAAFLPHLQTRPRAGIVVVASIAGEMALLEQIPYCTSKFAVRGFAEGLRLELAGSSISVTVVLPGAVTGTDINLNAPGALPTEARVAHEAMQRMPLSTTADSAGRRIVAALQQGKPRLIIGADARAMDFVVRAVPGRYSRIVRRPMVKLAAGFKVQPDRENHG